MNVKKLMCHAEFTCTRCRKPYLAMALVEVIHHRHGALTLKGDAECVSDGICNACRTAEHDVERGKYNKARKQRAWVARATKMGKVDAK